MIRKFSRCYFCVLAMIRSTVGGQSRSDVCCLVRVLRVEKKCAILESSLFEMIAWFMVHYLIDVSICFKAKLKSCDK